MDKAYQARMLNMTVKQFEEFMASDAPKLARRAAGAAALGMTKEAMEFTAQRRAIIAKIAPQSFAC